MSEAIKKYQLIPWIFFDLDDTIWNFSANSALALRSLYESSPILKKLFNDMNEFIDIYHFHNSRLWMAYGRGEVSTVELKVERWRRTLATRQFEVLTAVCEELERNYLDILACEKIEMEGVNELLEELSHRVLIGVLSNGFLHTQYKKIRYSGLDRWITRMIVSDEIGINKPDRRLFDYAIEETGASKPILMVGDNPETDILGAMKSGWHALWVNPTGHPFPYSKEKLKEMDINPELFLGMANTLKDLRPLLIDYLDSIQ